MNGLQRTSRGPLIARWFAAIAAEREGITSEPLDLAEFDCGSSAAHPLR